MINLPQNPNPQPQSVESPIFLSGSLEMNTRYSVNSRSIASLFLKNIEVEQQARTDGLTGIANRQGFDESITPIVNKLQEEENPQAAFIYIDLDNFKQVNDTHERGHDAGDEVLIAVANILQYKIGVREEEGETIGRLGGDEFAAVIQTGAGSNKRRNPDLSEDQVIDGFHARLTEGVAEVAKMMGMEKTLGVSIGVVKYQKGESAEQFRARADKEMIEAKRNKQDRLR